MSDWWLASNKRYLYSSNDLIQYCEGLYMHHQTGTSVISWSWKWSFVCRYEYPLRYRHWRIKYGVEYVQNIANEIKCHFMISPNLADDILNAALSISMSYPSFSMDLIDNKPSLVQVIAWRRTSFTGHYLKQWWPGPLTHAYASLCGDELYDYAIHVLTLHHHSETSE